MDGSVWTIGGLQVEVTSETRISGNAVVGARVACEAWARPDAMLLARSITVLASPEATPMPLEFKGYVKEIGSPWWTIGEFQVKVTGDTQISGQPVAGDLVLVRALQQTSGELWATSISVVTGTEVQINGVIEAYAGSSITVDGQTMAVTSATQFVGTPVVGWLAQVRALQFSDGSLTARIVVVHEPTATTGPAETATSVPTATPSP
jgi:hypothetical protein